MQSMAHSPTYLTSEEVAKKLNISTTTLSQMRVNGYGPSYAMKLGRSYLYDPVVVDAWIELQRKHRQGGE